MIVSFCVAAHSLVSVDEVGVVADGLGEVEVVATGDKGIQPVQKLGQVSRSHLLVQHVPDPQFIGAGKQRLGIGGLRHPEAGVMKRCPLSVALLGDLEEGST